MPSRLARVLAVVAVTAVAAQSARAGAALRKGPYLINPDDNTKMTVLWQSDATPASSLVEWDADGAPYANSSGALTESGNGADQHQFSHTITGLTPGAQYYYRVTVDGDQASGTFCAAPALSASSVTIYGYGDSRTNPATQEGVCSRLLADVNGDPASRQTLYLHCGDYVGSGSSESDWQDHHFNRSQAGIIELQRRMPMGGCLGNHELTGDLFRKYYPYPYVVGTAFYRSFDYGPVHVTAVDQYRAPYSRGSAQWKWILDDLVASDKKWKFVIFHGPAWSAGGSHENDTTAQSELCPMLEAEDVAVAFCGDNHYYARAVVAGVHHITSGGGGAPLYDPDAGYPNIVTVDKSNHYVRFDVSASQVTVTAVRSDGTQIESIAITKASTAPAAPSGLTAATASWSQIDLGWNDNSADESGFEVWRKQTAAGAWGVVDVVKSGVTAYSDTGLLPGEAYYYRVRSVNAAGRSAWTAEANDTTDQVGLGGGGGGGGCSAAPVGGAGLILAAACLIALLALRRRRSA